VNPDYFRGLEAFDRSHPGLLDGATVLIGGERSEARTRWPVCSWRRLAAK
jgi:hypothetical protein